MAEHQDNPPVGSVAEEAARLLDALGGWASTATAGYAAQSAPGAPAASEPAASAASAADRPDEPTDQPAAEPGGHSGGRCEACGAQNGMGQALTCQLCPVCQGIGFLRSVRPETVDRLADLAGAIAATLRDLASERRGGDGEADGDTGDRGRGRASTVQDIPVEDEDEARQGPAGQDTPDQDTVDHPDDGDDPNPGRATR